MELQLQKQESLLSPIQSTKFKSKSKTAAAASGGNKFVGVRQRPSGRWVSEIKDTTQKIRMWLGTFETAEEAARAYDEAACLLRGTNTRTNFSTRRPAACAADSPLANRIRKLLHHKKLAGAAASGGGGGGSSPTSSASNTTDSGGRKHGSTATSENYQEVYRPYFAADFHLGVSVPEPSPSSSWAFEAMFDGFELSKSVDFEVMSAADAVGGVVDGCAAAQVSEFERMKVERQISASLYAMNGVQEYFEAVQDLSSSSSLASALVDPDWDLPPLYHFY